MIFKIIEMIRLFHSIIPITIINEHFFTAQHLHKIGHLHNVKRVNAIIINIKWRVTSTTATAVSLPLVKIARWPTKNADCIGDGGFHKSYGDKRLITEKFGLSVC
jgi:hypothetical protein